MLIISFMFSFLQASSSTDSDDNNQVADDITVIKNCFYKIGFFSKNFSYIPANQLLKNHKTMRLLYYNKEYTIFENKISNRYYFIVCADIIDNYDWYRVLADIENDFICKSINVEDFEYPLTPYRLLNLQSVEIEKILQPLSCSSLCDKNDPAYIGNIIDDYDPKNSEKKLEIIKNIMRDILRAIICLNDQFLLHDAIRPSCIMVCKVDNKFVYKLFFFTNLFVHERSKFAKENKSDFTKESVISWDRINKSDVWSLGYTAMNLYLGYGFESNDSVICKEVKELHKNSTNFLIKKNFTGIFFEFLNDCLKEDMNYRKSAKELLEHAFLK